MPQPYSQTYVALKDKRATKKARTKFEALVKYPAPLPDEEICELLRVYRSGDGPESVAAGQKIVLHNMRFISKQAYKIAKQYSSRNPAWLAADLESEGALALMKCMKPGKFDEGYGVKFCSYAFNAVTRHMAVWAYCNDGGITRLPNHTVGIRRKLKAAREASRLNPDDEELRENVRQLARIKRFVDRARQGPASLVPNSNNAEISDPDDMRAHRVGLLTKSADDPARIAALNNDLASAERAMTRLKHTDHRKAYVLCSYFGMPGYTKGTLKEIGLTMGVTKEAVRQNKISGLTKMREMMGIAKPA